MTSTFDVVTPPLSSHPYLYLLYTNLAKLGVRIYDFDDRDRPSSSFKKILLYSNKLSIIHFHWIELKFKVIRLQNRLSIAILSSTFIFWVLFLKYVLQIKIIITLHNIVPHEQIFPKLEHLVFASLLRLSDAVIVHNHFSVERAINLYNIKVQKIFVIPHGNFISYYPNTISKEKARETLKIPQDAFVFLFLGWIRPYKGIELLLSVFDDLLNTTPNLFLIIAGKCIVPELKHRITDFKKRNNNCITQLEYVPDDEIQVYMNAADVGVLPYKEVTSPGSLLLFMSFGKPIVVSRTPSVIETVNDDFCVFFREADINDLRGAIINAKNQTRKQLAMMSQKAFENSRLIDWKDIAKMTLTVYDFVNGQ